MNPTEHTVTPTYTTGNTANGYYVYLGPADAATIYDTPNALNPAYSGTSYDGTGVTIGIAGDSNIDVTQNANYRATFGLSPKATTVVVDGKDPGENQDAIEAYLDTGGRLRHRTQREHHSLYSSGYRLSVGSLSSHRAGSRL